MPIFAKPAGGLQLGNRLFLPPRVVKLKLNTPARILFITDLHLRSGHPEMADTTLNACAQLSPQIILLGGDIAEYDEGLGLFLEKLRLRFPGALIYAVPGNNDDPRLEGDRERQRQLYARYGAEYLLNDCRKLELAGRRLEIAGLEDAYSHEPDPRGLFSGEGDVYRILLAHEPLKTNLHPEADLMLCGHTHGGQINVLGITCYLLLRYEGWFQFASLAGQKQIGKTRLIVSRGIGYSKFPVRFGARSELHYIE